MKGSWRDCLLKPLCPLCGLRTTALEPVQPLNLPTPTTALQRCLYFITDRFLEA